MRAHDGLLRRADLVAFQIVRNDPLFGTYRNFRVTTNQAPGGGIMLLEMLAHFEISTCGLLVIIASSTCVSSSRQ
jgi:gamma-glutamyltranspeptidase / glutathione hydrolase